MVYLIGLDIGTTGCKAALFDESGSLLASAMREYSISIPQPSFAEQNAEIVWTLAQEALTQVLHTSNRRQIAAVGLSVQGEAVIPVNAGGDALRPAILGMDTRTSAQNDWLRERFGAEHLFELTGMPVHTINTLPKLLWIKQHEPEIWHRAGRFMLYEDFLVHKMTGRAVVSRCLASRTQLYDLLQNCWCTEILDGIDLDVSRLSQVQPSGSAVQPMRAELADMLGFAAPPLVVTGGHDQACSALGVGLTRSGLAMVSTGTAEVMEVALPTPVLDPALREGNISVYAHVVEGLYLAMTLNHSGGLLLRWFRDTFSHPEMQQAQTSGESAYDLMLKGASAEPTSLLVLPHFSGSGTPSFDTASKGAILGLTFATTRHDLAKAILEGLTFELRVNADLLRTGGIAIQELRAVGGGARSALWVQLKADVMQLPVVVPRVTDSACWGAALLAGLGAGVFSDLSSAAAATVRLDQRFTPDAARSGLYEQRYQLYRTVYPAVAPISHQL